MNNEKFRGAADNILAREKERVRGAAKAELGAWEEDPERRMELFVLRKILTDRKNSGRALEWMFESYSANPHPLDVFLDGKACPPGLISRYLDEVRRDFERLQAQAGEGGGA
jgi:hypothetical protein